MKKLLALLLALIMMTTLFAACSAPTADETGTTEAATTEDAQAETAEEPSDEPITLKVAGWDHATIPSFNALAEAFMAKYPHITIETIDTPSADYNTKLNVMLNANSEVDVFYLKDAANIMDYNDKGQVLDMTAYADASGVDLAAYNGIAENFVVDGKLVAIPVQTNYYVNFYNKTLFDEAGVDYPTNDMTWEEFEALAREMTSGEGAEKIYGAYFHTWQALVNNWGVQSGEYTILDTDYSASMKASYEMVLGMQNDGIIQDYGTLKTANIHYSSAFYAGNVAMMPMGNWFIGSLLGYQISDGLDFEWGIATIPHPEGVEAGYTVGSTTGICISSNTEYADAAWEFVNFASGAEGAAIYAGLGFTPGMSTDADLETIATAEGMPADTAATAAALKTTNVVFDRPIAPLVADVNQMLGEEHSLIMLGEISSLDEELAIISDRSKEIQGIE